ncbi:DUF2267 domain-containing protein [Actinoallomurus sp. CA-142502]|uniref:DUF2267 domain-containing protein n=1 Tax=Actinoallomurus sp. CA-142502 TaxID=3239885 RepID=UPI003D91B65B
MEYSGFLQITQSEAGGDSAETERAARAVLTTLAERLSRGRAHDLLRQLPTEIKPWLDTERSAERFDHAEFLRRVAEREGVDPESAERDARAVFAALGRAVSDDAIAAVAEELPRDFEPLITEARSRFSQVMPTERFVAAVAERARLDPSAARRAADAVLEALAHRVTAVEIDDLIPRLPFELREPFRRGGGTAERMTLDRFLALIGDIEGVEPFEASEHARAVFAVLREAVGDDDYFTLTAGLPPDHNVLLPPP